MNKPEAPPKRILDDVLVFLAGQKFPTPEKGFTCWEDALSSLKRFARESAVAPDIRAREAAEEIQQAIENDPRMGDDADALAAIITKHCSPSAKAEKGLNLFRQLVRGHNALRDLDVFACNDGEHDDGCECFWEQCEAWAKSDITALETLKGESE